MAKDTSYYFSHDYNARMDQKIKSLLVRHGMVGYGVFWAIIEELYSNANAMRTDYDCIAYDLRVDKKVVESIINDFDLFVFDCEFFGSESVERRLNERLLKSQKASISASKRWENMRTQCERNAKLPKSDAIKESKGNKVKEIKENKEEGEFEILEQYPFSEFWELYDKKTGRSDCEKKYKKLSSAEKEKIFDTLPQYIFATPDKKFRKNPETYLNGKHWEDEIVITTGAVRKKTNLETLAEAYHDNSLHEKYLREELEAENNNQQ